MQTWRECRRRIAQGFINATVSVVGRRSRSHFETSKGRNRSLSLSTLLGDWRAILGIQFRVIARGEIHERRIVRSDTEDYRMYWARLNGLQTAIISIDTRQENMSWLLWTKKDIHNQQSYPYGLIDTCLWACQPTSKSFRFDICRFESLSAFNAWFQLILGSRSRSCMPLASERVTWSRTNFPK